MSTKNVNLIQASTLGRIRSLIPQGDRIVVYFQMPPLASMTVSVMLFEQIYVTEKDVYKD